MKRYIGAHAPRHIPVGYSAADVAENIEPQALYFACGEDDNARADFFAFNDYSWCDPSTFTGAGWDVKVDTYSDYPLPIFLSEFGCITNRRDWNEIAALYSDNMTSVYSGGLAYEFTTEPNGYGLVEDGSNGAEPNDDFDRLRDAFEATPAPTGDGGARTDSSFPECPPEDEEWAVTTENLPEMPVGAQQYMRDGSGTGPGLSNETGSQWAGTPTETSQDLSDGVTTSESTSNENGGSSTSGGSTGSGSGSGSGSSNSSNDSSDAAGESAATGLKATAGSVFIAAVAALVVLY